MPGLPPFVFADILRRWLQVQGILKPAITTGIIVNLINIGANFIFISYFGLVGSPIATSLSRWLQVVILLGLVRSKGLHVKHGVTTWPTWYINPLIILPNPSKKPLIAL